MIGFDRDNTTTFHFPSHRNQFNDIQYAILWPDIKRFCDFTAVARKLKEKVCKIKRFFFGEFSSSAENWHIFLSTKLIGFGFSGICDQSLTFRRKFKQLLESIRGYLKILVNHRIISCFESNTISQFSLYLEKKEQKYSRHTNTIFDSLFY